MASNDSGNNNEQPDVVIEFATVTRVLVYTGPKKWIELTLQRGNIPMNGKKEFPAGATIESGMVQWEPNLPPADEQQQQPAKLAPVYVPPPRGGRTQ